MRVSCLSSMERCSHICEIDFSRSDVLSTESLNSTTAVSANSGGSELRVSPRHQRKLPDLWVTALAIPATMPALSYALKTMEYSAEVPGFVSSRLQVLRLSSTSP